MPDNLDAGTFRIISLTKGNPRAGVSDFRIAFQFIRLNMDFTDWVVAKVHANGADYYPLRVGGYKFTGVYADPVVGGEGVDDDKHVYKIIASGEAHQSEPWIITYRAPQDAYTIAQRIDKGKYVWTVPPHAKGDTHPLIEIRPLEIKVQPDKTERFPDSQLFQFVKVGGGKGDK